MHTVSARAVDMQPIEAQAHAAGEVCKRVRLAPGGATPLPSMRRVRITMSAALEASTTAPVSNAGGAAL